MSPSARTKESDDREHGSGPPPAGSPAYRGSPRGVGGHQGTATTDRDPEAQGRRDGGSLGYRTRTGQAGREPRELARRMDGRRGHGRRARHGANPRQSRGAQRHGSGTADRKSTRLNSSH